MYSIRSQLYALQQINIYDEVRKMMEPLEKRWRMTLFGDDLCKKVENTMMTHLKNSLTCCHVPKNMTRAQLFKTVENHNVTSKRTQKSH